VNLTHQQNFLVTPAPLLAQSGQKYLAGQVTASNANPYILDEAGNKILDENGNPILAN